MEARQGYWYNFKCTWFPLSPGKHLLSVWHCLRAIGIVGYTMDYGIDPRRGM